MVTYKDCPHYHGIPDGVGECDENEMRKCREELGQECVVFLQFLEEASVCLECFELRPGDERVEAGMKCAYCAGEWIPDTLLEEGRR